jgi:protein arginine kinase
MTFDELLARPAGWMVGAGDESHVVVTSRVRLARNLSEGAFPGWAEPEQRIEAMEKVLPVLMGLGQLEGGFVGELSTLGPAERQVLVERHLISRQHATKGKGCAALISAGQEISVMVNEEDHLRVQAMRAGLDLEGAYEACSAVDDGLDGLIEYAFDDELGYLTACPSNVGTGMRASAMLHLPALVLAEQIGQIIKGVNQVGLAVRGLYGEGSGVLGNLFQVSNQSTLGESEGEIIQRMRHYIGHIVEAEENARQVMKEEGGDVLADHIARAYGLLRHAHILPSKEALNHLSLLRLGCDLGSFPGFDRGVIDLLTLEIQPAHIQLPCERRLEPAERDLMRAEIVHERLKDLPGPRRLSRGVAPIGLEGAGEGSSPEEPEA